MERERERGEKHETERDGDRETTTLGSDQRRVDQRVVYIRVCVYAYTGTNTRGMVGRKKRKKKTKQKKRESRKRALRERAWRGKMGRGVVAQDWDTRSLEMQQ